MHAKYTGLAARLAPWLRSWRSGLTSLDDVVTAMTNRRQDEQFVVHDDDGEAAVDLFDGLSRISKCDADDVRLVLAVPGDARGLPTSGDFAAAALTAGEAITAGNLGIVPIRHTHVSGSNDTWHSIEWRIFVTEPPLPAESIPTGEADLALTEALAEATRTLDVLDVAGWRDNSEAMTRIRGAQDFRLPPGFGQRECRVYARACLLDAAMREAESDAMGGAVTAYEASARFEALRPLAAACRQAIVAACHARLTLRHR